MTCDICGKVGTQMIALNADYQTNEIKSICPDCENVVNAKCSKLLTFVLKMRCALTKRFMQERRARHEN